MCFAPLLLYGQSTFNFVNKLHVNYLTKLHVLNEFADSINVPHVGLIASHLFRAKAGSQDFPHFCYLAVKKLL